MKIEYFMAAWVSNKAIPSFLVNYLACDFDVLKVFLRLVQIYCDC